MILREFCLHPSEKYRNQDVSDACAYRSFCLEACFVCDLYRRSFPKFTTKETAKVIVEVSPESDWCDRRNLRRFPSVTFSPWRLELHSYLQIDNDARPRLALETLHSGLCWLAEVEGWPLAPFQSACDGCLEKNLRNTILSTKPIPNPSRSARVQLLCEFGMHEARVHAIVTRGRKEIGRVYLGSIVAEAYIVQSTLKSLAWLDDSRIQVEMTFAPKVVVSVFDLASIIEQK